MPASINVTGLEGGNSSPSADYKSTQLRHRFDPLVVFPGPVDAIEQVMHRMRGAEPLLVQVAAWMEDVPTGGDEVSIDLHYSLNGSAFTSLLTTPLVFDAGSSNNVVQLASIAVTALAAGGLLKVIVDVTGMTGANLGVQVVVDEKAGP